MPLQQSSYIPGSKTLQVTHRPTMTRVSIKHTCYSPDNTQVFGHFSVPYVRVEVSHSFTCLTSSTSDSRCPLPGRADTDALSCIIEPVERRRHVACLPSAPNDISTLATTGHKHVQLSRSVSPFGTLLCPVDVRLKMIASLDQMSHLNPKCLTCHFK